MLALERLSAISEGDLPSHILYTTPPEVEIDDSDTPPRVQSTVSPPRVQEAATPPRVVHPTVTHIMVPNSHRRLHPTPCLAVTPSTPHIMVRRSATQQHFSSDMLADTVQQANHVFSLPAGPAIKTAKNATNNAPVILMP
jgi:hypothetical protein